MSRDVPICEHCGDFDIPYAHECNQNLPPKPRHLHGDSRFHKILEEMRTLHAIKASDYGADEDPLANLRASEDFGIPAWLGSAIRMNDKMRRIMSFAKRGELKNESLIDSFNDLAAYAILCRILYEEAHGAD